MISVLDRLATEFRDVQRSAESVAQPFACLLPQRICKISNDDVANLCRKFPKDHYGRGWDGRGGGGGPLDPPLVYCLGWIGTVGKLALPIPPPHPIPMPYKVRLPYSLVYIFASQEKIIVSYI